MPHAPEDSEVDNWHRYFAMESNNRAWVLASQPSRSEAMTRNWHPMNARMMPLLLSLIQRIAKLLSRHYPKSHDFKVVHLT